MVTAQAPLRLTLAGGGTDLPAWYRRYGGFVVTAPINLFVRVSVVPGGRMRVPGVDQHRYALAAGWQDTDLVGIESDVPPGSGLGGSGALMVALLRARWPELAHGELAAAAFNLERYALGHPVGWQDAVAASYRESVSIGIDTDGQIDVKPFEIPPRLHETLVLFATGIVRDAGQVLAEQASAVVSEAARADAMRTVAQTGRQILDDLMFDHGAHFGLYLDQHWRAKKQTCQGMTTPQIDEWYELGLANGAIGGKLCGAGGGGHLLFSCPPSRRDGLVSAMQQAGLKPVPFAFLPTEKT